MKIYRTEAIPQLEIKSRLNPRAKRLTLRRDVRGGGFTVSYPNRVKERDIQSFIDQNSDWLAKHHQPIKPIEIGATLLFRGSHYPIVRGEKRGVRFDGQRILVHSANPSRSIATFLKSQAQLYAPSKLDGFADKLGKTVQGLRWRDPKSRWGSCDNQGVIMLSWRLIMAPDEIFDYVIAHEVAHLVEMNHSERYWAVVDRIYPDHKRARAWLRNEGRALQSIVFE